MASVMEPTVAAIDEVNPMGTDGFEFVEYAAPDPAALGALFEQHGLRGGRAGTAPRTCSLYRQGDINFIVNAEPDSFAQALRARARPVDLRHRVPREGRGQRLQARASSSAPGASRARSGRWSSTSRRSRASAIR